MHNSVNGILDAVFTLFLLLSIGLVGSLLRVDGASSL